MSTAILLHNQAEGFIQRLGLYVAIVLVSLASYVILRIAGKSTKLLNPIAMNIATRIMGLLLAAVAIQFMLNALRELCPKFFSAI
jgi:multiple antibiotic resistance protein